MMEEGMSTGTVMYSSDEKSHVDHFNPKGLIPDCPAGAVPAPEPLISASGSSFLLALRVTLIYPSSPQSLDQLFRISQ